MAAIQQAQLLAFVATATDVEMEWMETVSETQGHNGVVSWPSHHFTALLTGNLMFNGVVGAVNNIPVTRCHFEIFLVFNFGPALMVNWFTRNNQYLANAVSVRDVAAVLRRYTLGQFNHLEVLDIRAHLAAKEQGNQVLSITAHPQEDYTLDENEPLTYTTPAGTFVKREAEFMIALRDLEAYARFREGSAANFVRTPYPVVA